MNPTRDLCNRAEAREAFMTVLDKRRLSDAARTPDAFRHLFVA